MGTVENIASGRTTTREGRAHLREEQRAILKSRHLEGRSGPGGSTWEQRAVKVPKTDDELWELIKWRTGYEIPRVAVCEDHCAPFDFIADAFFNRESALLVLASRESGKTLQVSILHVCKAECYSGTEGCVSADTLIDCPRDHRRFPNGIPISQIRPGQLVWTLNEEDVIFELKPVVKAARTRRDVPIYRLMLDDGHVIRATADHRFLKRDGNWAELRELRPGDSLMPMYRDFDPFVRIRPDATLGGGRVLEYEAVALVQWGKRGGDVRKGMHVDHVDDTRANTDPDNLQLLDGAEHCRKTMTGRNVGWRRRRQQSEVAKELRVEHRAIVEREVAALRLKEEWELTPQQQEALKRADEREHQGQRLYTCTICQESFWRRTSRARIPLCPKCKTELRVCPVCGDIYTLPRKGRRKTCSRRCGQILRHMVHKYRPKPCNRCGTDFIPASGTQQLCSDCRDPYQVAYAAGRRRELQKEAFYNHKIASIEPDGHEDVWDMEVEDNHNFVVHGVVLHNCTFGAIEAQARRAYRYVNSLVFEVGAGGEKRIRPQVESSLRSETRWKNSSMLEVIIASKSGVNSPHPQTVHADEVDLMLREIFMESRSMSSSKKGPDGRWIPAQDIVTSTRKSSHGVMQELLDEVSEAEEKGYEAPWKIYAFCFAEVAQEVPCCRRAPATEREKRLRELGQDPSILCDCNRVVKGDWGAGKPRTLESVCRGRLFHSRGWMPYVDIKRKFRQNTQTVWEAQMECRRPMADGLYLPGWTRERYTVRDWQPRIDLGQIWMGVDWGGNAVSAVSWIHGPLRMPVKAIGVLGEVYVPAGAYVVFDELFQASMGASRLADIVVSREIAWRQRFPGFRVSARFTDPAGRQQREDWHEHNPPLRTVWYASRDIDPTIKNMQDLVEDGLLWIDSSRCSRTCDDIEAWRQRNGREVHDDASHIMAAIRYAMINTMIVERKRRNANQTPTTDPVVVQRGQSLDPVVSGSRPGYESEKWRISMGHYSPNSSTR